MTATGTLAIPAPRFTDPRTAPVLRWGVLAPGGIAGDFVTALRLHTDQEIVAVGSRSRERAERFAMQHGIASHYGSYEALVADQNVDVVYVAAPHNEHARLAQLAIAAGKHVLVEKPFTVTASEAQGVVDAARAAGVFAMEAMWTRYLPQSDIVRQLLDNGDLGDVRVVTGDFGAAARFDPASRLFDPQLSGGALLDLGIYPVSWASFVLGTPAKIFATGDLAPTGVDAQCALVLTSGDGGQAILSTGLRARTPSRASIAGTLARIDIDPPFWCASGLQVEAGDGAVTTWHDDFGRPRRQGLCYQAAALARFVTRGLTESPIHSLDETVAIIATIDEARRMLGSFSAAEASQ